MHGRQLFVLATFTIEGGCVPQLAEVGHQAPPVQDHQAPENTEENTGVEGADEGRADGGLTATDSAAGELA